MTRIKPADKKVTQTTDIIEYLFGWIYIGWIRKSLIAVSLILVLLFTYQQTMIFKGVKNLSNRIIMNGNSSFSFTAEDIEKELLLYRIPGFRINSEELDITEEQLVELLNSYKNLQDKYRDIIDLIEGDPVLKEYIEKKLNENNYKKSNL